MGRPSMNVKPMLVRLPEGMTKRIDALLGRGKCAQFIREAVEKELIQREAEAKRSSPKRPKRT